MTYPPDNNTGYPPHVTVHNITVNISAPPSSMSSTTHRRAAWTTTGPTGYGRRAQAATETTITVSASSGRQEGTPQYPVPQYPFPDAGLRTGYGRAEPRLPEPSFTGVAGSSQEEYIPQPPTRDSDAGPILFYDSDKPYYQFTNFAPVSVKYNERMYPTAEHLFQAHKFFQTYPDIAERIRQLPTARAALEEASRNQRLQRRDWFEVNIAVMEEVLEAKFRQHRHLQRRLLNTGHRDLVEASPIDSFWGSGPNGHGRNELGKALMKLRGILQVEESVRRRARYQ